MVLLFKNSALNFLIDFNTKILCDAPEAWQIGMQDPATPQAEGMIFFHHYLLIFIIMIGIAVCYVLVIILQKFSIKNNPEKSVKFSHDSLLEVIWTVAPALSLVFIAVPSFNLLYSLDELVNPTLTVKVIGHQWYWSYEYSDFSRNFGGGTLYFDSYMVNTDELEDGHFRLLEVDYRLILPVRTHIRILVTASDVLHSWAIPSFGIKVDACPGRLSQASLFIKRIGVYYGQCSEICGINHGFMPIVVESAPRHFYLAWILANLGANYKLMPN